MKHLCFRLLGTYEFVPKSARLESTFRIEVFSNNDTPLLYRCRVWSYRQYRVTLPATSQQTMSHDLQPYDLTHMLSDQLLGTGVSAQSEADFLSLVSAEITEMADWLRE